MAGKTYTILVCDDEKSIVRMLESRLKANHYGVITAKDGEEALARTRREKPDLLILDLAMPGKNGYQVCYELKKDPGFSHIPIIILSAWVRDKVGEEKALADVYLTKPFEPEVLLGEIEQLLSGGFTRPEVS